MSIFNALIGNASEINQEKLAQEFSTILVDGEQIESAFKLVRDLIVFTNKRLVLVDKQGLTGKKVAYVSIPYRNITKFAKESQGTFDLDAEIKVWVRSDHSPINLEFRKDKNVNRIYQILSSYVLG